MYLVPCFDRLALKLRKALGFPPKPDAPRLQHGKPSADPPAPVLPATPPAVPMLARIMQWFDVLGAPIMIARKTDGTEVAIDYSDFPRCSEVPLDWARAFGNEIDRPRWLGLILSRRFRDRAPVVAIGEDGSAFVITPKATVTRIGGQWMRGYHMRVQQKMYRVGKGAEHIVAESQRALRHPRLQSEAERVGPRSRVLTAGNGRTIVIDDDGARSHVGDRWLPGIRFAPDVIARMRRIVDPAEQKRHLKFIASCDAMALALVNTLNTRVMERHGGIDENLPGFPPTAYSDSEIEESRRQAAAIIARAAGR